MKQRLFLMLVVLAVLLLSGCKQEEEPVLRMGVLPIMDTVPFYVADQNGYFSDRGLQVELVPIKSALESAALIQAGGLDGLLTDLPTVGIFNREESQLKIVGMARKSYPNAPLFRLLAAPGSEINSPMDLAGVKIGISQNTVIEYITDRMLLGSGLSPGQIAIEEVSAIPVRFEQLMAGQIAAATLPDPLAQGAIAGGAKLVVDDSQFTEYSQSVLVFSVQALEAKPDTVEKFLQAWNQAAGELNADPEAYRNLLIEKGRVPESIQGSFSMPPFPEEEITSEAQWADVVDWLLEKELIDQAIPYQDAVDDSFLE